MASAPMQPDLNEQALYDAAKKRTDDIIGFFIHALVYVLVNAGLWVLDLVTGGGINWAYWTTIPWGIGLAIHGAVLFAELKVFGDDWRQRRIEKYVEQRRGRGAG
ncbi:MAG: 2TM domain-containing protein [Dehalococcoidia bacterium]